MSTELNDPDEFFWLVFSLRLNKYVIWSDVQILLPSIMCDSEDDARSQEKS
jgi:hypothetical protein